MLRLLPLLLAGAATVTPALADPLLILISANAEWRETRLLFPRERYLTGPYGEYFRTRLHGHDTVIVHGGWGKIASAASTEWAIREFRPSHVLNLGTCGGFRGRIPRFAIIAATRTVAYDILEQMGDPEAALRHFSTPLDTGWTRSLPNLTLAPMLSADRDLLPADIPALTAKYNAVAVDWESASIAWVTARHRKPTAILRGVSDLVGPTGGDAYGNEAHFTAGTATVMKKLFDGLGAWLAAFARPPA